MFDDIMAKALSLHYGIKLSTSAQQQFDSNCYLLKRRIYSNYDESSYLSINVPQEIVFPESKTVSTVILKRHSPLTIDYQENKFFLLNDYQPLYRKEVSFSKRPSFYGKIVSNGDKVEQYITKLFGHTLGLFVNTGCYFADSGKACKFCSIKANQGRPADVHSLARISDILEAIGIAVREDDEINCIFVSGGVTSRNFDDNFDFYCEIALSIRKYLDMNGFSKVEVTLNTYPPRNLALIQKLKGTSVAIMLSAETVSNTLRSEICPGKADLFNCFGIDTLFSAFVDAVGYGRVMSFVIEGLENPNAIMNGVQKYAQMGVCIIVHVLHVDPGTWIYDHNFAPPPYDEIINLASFTSHAYHDYKLDTSVLYGGRSSLDAESSISIF